MLSEVALWAAGILVGVVCKSVLPKMFNSFMVGIRKDAKSKAEQYLKDPEIRAWVNQGIALAQKQASKDSSINKLKLAGNWLKAKIPGPIDDAIIDAMIELMIVELKNPMVL